MRSDAVTTPVIPGGARILHFPTRSPRADEATAWLRQLRCLSREEDRATALPDELVASVLSACRASA